MTLFLKGSDKGRGCVVTGEELMYTLSPWATEGFSLSCKDR
jgi:hypothetical protein